jgi:hypothetical protein
MQLPASYCYPRSASSKDTMNPVSALDGVMYHLDTQRPNITYYCPSTGDILSDTSFSIAIENAANKKYPATDHTPISIQVGAYKILYVSLDNSVRSMKNEFPLTQSSKCDSRLDQICNIINKIQPDIVFFSEACRKCVNIGSDVVFWSQMKRIIANSTGLIFGCEQANNFSTTQMSFGVAMFYRSTVDYIIAEQGVQLLHEDANRNCYGSGAVLIRLNTGETVVGVHFPLDFKGAGEDNNNYRATKALIKLLEQYPYAVAIGDMNIVEGNIENCMRSALTNTNWSIARDHYSFLPSFFDNIPNDPRVPEITTLGRVEDL